MTHSLVSRLHALWPIQGPYAGRSLSSLFICFLRLFPALLHLTNSNEILYNSPHINLLYFRLPVLEMAPLCVSWTIFSYLSFSSVTTSNSLLWEYIGSSILKFSHSSLVSFHWSKHILIPQTYLNWFLGCLFILIDITTTISPQSQVPIAFIFTCVLFNFLSLFSFSCVKLLHPHQGILCLETLSIFKSSFIF